LDLDGTAKGKSKRIDNGFPILELYSDVLNRQGEGGKRELNGKNELSIIYFYKFINNQSY